MRSLGITLLSLVITSVVIGNSYYQKKQFYPSVVYITKSNPSMAVIYIQAFTLGILSGTLMRKIFFGELRTVELQHLMERSWYFSETCLAFTLFRDGSIPKLVALFALLSFLKTFHWLADERVDFMERSPVISWLFHVRIISVLFMLGILDIAFVLHSYQTLNKGAPLQLVFGFEYAILLTIVLNIVIKYAFHVNDSHEMPWENKAVFLLYTELVIGLIKVILYFSFVFIMVRIHTLPFFAFRPMYYTVRAFKKAIHDVILSRRAIGYINTLYPATPEELAAADNVCIICREEMHSAPKKLPCNHIFHTSCLRIWFLRQQTCPTCRLDVLRTPGSTQAPQPPQRPRQDQQPPQRPDFHRRVPNPPMADDNGGHVPGIDSSHQPSRPTVPPPGHPQMPATDDLPPSLYPPFPIDMPFNVPIPPTESLSDEELRRMESQTREGVEARVKCLQNIQALLDASVIMMQQYCAANQCHIYTAAAPNSSARSSKPVPSPSAPGPNGTQTYVPASTSQVETSQTGPQRLSSSDGPATSKDNNGTNSISEATPGPSTLDKPQEDTAAMDSNEKDILGSPTDCEALRMSRRNASEEEIYSNTKSE